MRHEAFRKNVGPSASSSPWRLVRALSFTAMIALALSCGGADQLAPKPVATFGSSPGAEKQFRSLMRGWGLGTADDRRRLEKDLQQFIIRFPQDDLVRLARVLIAFNALGAGKLEQARKLAQDAVLGPAGTTRDLGTLVVGAVYRRSGHHAKALAELDPLLHKLLDPWATAILDEELVEAAVGAKRWSKAIKYMEVWLRETPPGSQQLVMARIEELLAEVSQPDLLKALKERTATPNAKAHLDIARLIAGQLAKLARAHNDVGLARTLLKEIYRNLLGRHGEGVARLAVDRTRARVLPRTVGLLLSLRNPELSRRSADVATGMAFGLGLPGSRARLVTRDGGSKPEQIEAALDELAANGAVIIVAGLDPNHNPVVQRFSSATHLPVILLTAGPRVDTTGLAPVFVIGETPARTVEKLTTALRADGHDRIAGFGSPLRTGNEGDPAVGTYREYGCNARPSAVELKAAGIDALLIRNGAGCGAGLLATARTLRVPVAVGLGVAALTGRLPATARILAAGVFPIDPQQPDPALKPWLDTGRRIPSWWAALGRDAATLSWNAVEHLHKVATEDPAQVLAGRKEAAAELKIVKAKLWTSSSDRFGSACRVGRDITIRTGEQRAGR